MSFARSEIFKTIESRIYPRAAVSERLLEYNKMIGADAAAFRNIEKLAENGSFCVITGQQLGMMGGPSYTILKAVSCLLAAREAGAVPIFWLATEDHDTAEIDHAYLLSEQGDLKKYQLDFPEDGKPVEDLVLEERHIAILREFAGEVGADRFLDFGDKSYSSVMAKLLSKMFAGTGLVFLEPKILRPLMRGFLKKEISASQEISELLQEAPEGPLKFSSGNTNLFLKNEKGQRVKILREKENFNAGGQYFTERQLLSLADESPGLFSSAAAARPIVQSSLLPTIMYVAGPTEEAYLRQLEGYHRYHRVPLPLIAPRLSLTFITPAASLYLKKCGLSADEKIPESWEELYPLIGQKLKGKERKKAFKEHLEKQGIPGNALHYLRNFLQPHNDLQERTLNFWEFQSKTSKNLIGRLFENLSWPYPTDHQFVEIGDE